MRERVVYNLQALFSLQAFEFNEQIRNARKIVACPLEAPDRPKQPCFFPTFVPRGL